MIMVIELSLSSESAQNDGLVLVVLVPWQQLLVLQAGVRANTQTVPWQQLLVLQAGVRANTQTVRPESDMILTQINNG